MNSNLKNDISTVKRKTFCDKIVKGIFFFIALLCASVIVVIVSFILVKGLQPFIKQYEINGEFYNVSFWKFLTGNTWFISPNKYGVGYIILDTLYIVFLSLLLSIPLSILTALLIVRIAPKKIGGILNSIIELLNSIPSIIYGLFGMGFITVFVKKIGLSMGIQSSGGISTLSTVLVLAMMIYPTITMISISSIKAVKKDLIEGSLALGASKTQTNFKVVLKASKSGIFTGIILGVGRALGEATAISMVCGNAGSGPNFGLFSSTRTLTTTILTGLSETWGLNYDIRYTVGIVLIFIIIIVDIILNQIQKRIGK